MKRHKTIESLSSISSNSSESESDENNSDDESDSDKSQRSDLSQDGREIERKRRNKKKRQEGRNQSTKIELNREPKRKSTLNLKPSHKKTILINDLKLVKKRSNSIDSPQKIIIRPNRRQMTYQYPKINVLRSNERNQFQFNQHAQNQMLRQQRRLLKARSINEFDLNLLQNSNGNSRGETRVDYEDDYNIQTQGSNNKIGSQSKINNRKPSFGDIVNITNESTSSIQQLNPNKQLLPNQHSLNSINNGYLNPSQVYTSKNPSLNILLEKEEGQIEQLKQEKEELKNQLKVQLKQQNTLEVINNNLTKECDQQNQLLNNISNKLDIKSTHNQTITTERNSNNYILGKINQLSVFTKQLKPQQKSNLLLALVGKVKEINPFKKQLKQINDKIGDSGSLFFEFILFLILLHGLLAVFYLYFYIDYLKNSSQTFNSSYQSFMSYLISHNYTSNTYISYTTTFIIMVVIQLAFTLIKYILQAREEVAYKAQYGKQLKTFRLVFSSWDMNVSQQNYVERMKVSLTQRIKNFLNTRRGLNGDEGTMLFMSKKKKEIRRISSFQKFIMIITIISLNIGFIIGSLICTNLIVQSDFMESRDNIFFNQLLKCLGITLTAYTTGYFLKILTECESWFHHSYKHIDTIKYSKMLLAHILNASLFLFLNLTQVKYQEETLQFLMIETIQFNDIVYNCPEEQFAYSLLSLFLAYAFTCLIIQYIPNLTKILINSLCTSSKAQSEVERSQYYLSAFNPIDNVIPLIMLNVLSICLAPFFPFIFMVSYFSLLGIYFHHYFYVGRFKMASFEFQDRQQIRSIITQLFSFCNLLAYIFLGVILSMDYQKKLFNASPDNIQRTCGAYQSGETPLKLFQSYLQQNNIIGALYEAVNFRPLLWVLFLFYFFGFLIKNTTQQEWKIQYKQKSKELYIMKTHFQDQVYNLQDKIIQVKSNININNSPKNIKTPTSRLTPQRDYYQCSTGKNSPVNSNVLQINNQSNTGSGQFASNSSLNNQPKENMNNNNNSKPSLFQRTLKQSGTYVGIGNLIQIPDSFSSALNKYQ